MAGTFVGDGSISANMIAAAGGWRISFNRDDRILTLRKAGHYILIRFLIPTASPSLRDSPTSD